MWEKKEKGVWRERRKRKIFLDIKGQNSTSLTWNSETNMIAFVLSIFYSFSSQALCFSLQMSSWRSNLPNFPRSPPPKGSIFPNLFLLPIQLPTYLDLAAGWRDILNSFPSEYDIIFNPPSDTYMFLKEVPATSMLENKWRAKSKVMWAEFTRPPSQPSRSPGLVPSTAMRQKPLSLSSASSHFFTSEYTDAGKPALNHNSSLGAPWILHELNRL